MSQEYEVKLDLFEGPLDLLLYLVNKAEVEIAEICVAEVTAQYLEYLQLMRELNINIAAEYLHMAATLIRLKARELLPGERPEESTGEESEIVSRQQLIEQLLEYRKFKEAARSLRSFEGRQFGSFPRGMSVEPEFEEEESSVVEPVSSSGNLTVFDLLTAFKRVLEEASKVSSRPHVVDVETVKLEDRIEHVIMKLDDCGEVRFADLFADDLRRITLVVTFMAVLELVRLQEVHFRQEERFGTIYVMRSRKEHLQG